jgi:phosphoglycolate phosphatase
MRLLVCDLDNTLYDWVGYFVPAFYSMVDEAVRITGCDRDELLDDFRSVHRLYKDSEYPFALLETGVVKRKFGQLDRREAAMRLDTAFHAFNSRRKNDLRLYPGVDETLRAISGAGIGLVAHTESSLYAAVDRLDRLGIANLFSRVYCRERPLSRHPNVEAAQTWLGKRATNPIVELSHHQRKPDVTVLLEICRGEGVSPQEAMYVGDSIARDVLMAKGAGLFAVWAKYGSSHSAEMYSRLVRVSHWSEEDIAREKELKDIAKSIAPDAVLDREFGEILPLLGVFERCKTRSW